MKRSEGRWGAADRAFLGLFLTVLAGLFGPLVLHPGLIPGNFGDIYSYHYPLRHMAAASLQGGRVPLWNPYIFAGAPFAANPQALLFYPLALLHYFLPLSWAFSLDAFLHLGMAGLGAQLLLRKWGLEPAGAFTLAAAYALSPFLVYRIAQGVPTHLAALSWAPWIWLFALGGGPLLFAAAFGLQVLSGHPQFALIDAGALVVFLLVRRPAGLAALAQGGCLALFLTAVQVLPTLEYLGRSVRAHWSSAFSLGYSMSAYHLKTLVDPNAWGNPLQKGYAGYPSEFFEMFGVYLGLAPLALAAFALLRPRGAGRTRLALAAVAGTGLFLAFGSNNPLYVRLQSSFGLDFLRVPARFSFLILWALWLAAALGWKAALTRRDPLWKAALAALTLADLGLWSRHWVYAQEPQVYVAANPEAVSFLRGGERIATSPETLAPDKGMLYRLLNATGYEAFYPEPIARYTARSERGPAADGSRTYIRHWRTPEMAALSVRYYLSPEPVAGEVPVYQRGSTYIYENHAPEPLVRGAIGTFVDPEHWVLRLDGPGAVVVSQAYYPGWKAWSGGRRVPVTLEDGLFPRIEPPAGPAGPTGPPGPPRTVHFLFQPDSWLLGLMISLTSGLLCTWLALLRLLGAKTGPVPYEYPHC